jgi:signal transduction histidine kinase
MLKLLRSPQFPDDLEETLRGEILLFWILVLTGGYGLVGLSLARALRPLPFLELFSIPTITCLTAYTLLQQRKITAVAITLCGGGLAALMFSTYHGGGLMAPGLYALLVPVVIAGFTLNRLAMSVLFSAILTYIVFLTWAQTTGRLPDPIYVQPLVNRALVIVLVIGGIGVMVWWSTRHTESVLKMLESENKERREAERQVRLLNQTLEERVRERTADLDAFTAMVAHDLRGPIITVGGYASLLKE